MSSYEKANAIYNQIKSKPAKILEHIKMYMDEDEDISSVGIADEIIDLYKSLGELGMREKYESVKEIYVDCKLILDDLSESPQKVYRFIQELEVEMFDYIRLLAMKQAANEYQTEHA